MVHDPLLDPRVVIQIKAKMQAPIINAFEKMSTAYADTSAVGDDGIIE